MFYLVLLLGILFIGYILTGIAQYILFKPQKKRWPLTLPFQNIWIAPHVSGVYLPATSAQSTLLFFHGRGGNVSHFENFAKTYAPLGYGILMVDYPGFGFSKGKPSQKQLETAAISTVSYALHTLKLPPQQIVLFGHSLGNYPALAAAKHYKSLALKAVILQSPFLSAPQLAAAWAVGYHTWAYQLMGALVTPFLLNNRFDNVSLTKGLSVPLLVCMSKTDPVLPWQISAKLADYFPHAKRFLSPAGGHDAFDWAAPAVHQFLSGIPASLL